jgi:UDP-GlcNAc:undecaprenyl-phosphate/decaprenyl-phosphate GlcNAc-1-phosphate transferase
MYSLCFLAIASCLLCLLLTPLARDWSARLGLVDRPDRRRKIHPEATPRTGGVPIMISYVAAYGLLFVSPLRAGGVIQEHMGAILSLLPPVGLAFATGLLDDWLSLKPWQKLVGQLLAAGWAYQAGVRFVSMAGHPVAPWCGCLMTIAWLVLCCNAFNLIDGVDGLATGVGLAATLTTLAAALLHGDVMLALATAPLAGCLVGFLRYNFNPASIFLGDSGSLLIGFLLGSYGIIWSQKSAPGFGFAAPAMALALPLLEVCLSVVRRFLASEPIFGGDRGHIHHRLLDFGFTPRRVALLLYGVCTLGAVLSLLPSVVRQQYAGAVIVAFGLATWLGVHCLRYVEFEAASRFIWNRLRPMLRGHVQLERLERALRAASTIPECWHAVEDAALSLGYSEVNARLAGARYATSSPSARNGAYWQMRLNLPGNDYVNITQRGGAAGNPILVIPFVELLSRVLPPKLESVQIQLPLQTPASPRTAAVLSSDWAAPSVNPATPS